MIPNWLIEVLCCPETDLGFMLKEGKLIREDGKEFMEDNGILSLVYPSSLKGNDAKMNRLYERIAPAYDLSERVFGWLLAGVHMQRGREEIISLLNLKPNLRLLEVSPGPGVFQPILRKALGNEAEIISLDLSSKMLRQCQRNSNKLNVQLIQGNAQYLPFKNESFDALFHFGGINLFNYPNKALSEFVRVTRPGGLVAWGDEQMSRNFKHPLGRKLLPKINPGFLKEPPKVPDGLSNVEKHEVYQGLGYLMVAQKDLS